MDLRDPNRFPQRRPTSSKRFLDNHAPSGSISSGDELSEDDVVFLGGDYAQHNDSHSPSSSSTSSTPRHHLHNSHNHHSYKEFGILAALPGNETSVNGRSGLHMFHKSSGSSSSSRIIPVIPKPSQGRIPLQTLSSSSVKLHHQSAPVNVPILTQEMMKTRRRYHEFDEDAVDEDDELEEMLPPHVMVARRSAQTCSVLEGAGRTLKGRDLRKVRNAVLRRTGFLD